VERKRTTKLKEDKKPEGISPILETKKKPRGDRMPADISPSIEASSQKQR